MLRKIAGPTCHICLLPAPPASLPQSFPNFSPPPQFAPCQPARRWPELLPPRLAPPRTIHAARAPPSHAHAVMCLRAAICSATPLTRSLRRRRRRARPRHRHAHRATAAAPHTAHAAAPCTPFITQPQPTHSHSARKLFDKLPEPRWVARRGRERRLWSRSRSACGPVQRGRPRGMRWGPRPPRSRRQAVLVRSRSGSSQPEAEAGAELEEVGPSGLRLRQLQGQIV